MTRISAALFFIVVFFCCSSAIAATHEHHNTTHNTTTHHSISPFDKSNEKILGCTTVNRLYITPIGDVLVCPYVHIKIGNIFKQTIKEITDYGFRIKHFRNYREKCLAGEDLNFIKKFSLKIFIIYRIILSLFLLTIVYL